MTVSTSQHYILGYHSSFVQPSLTFSFYTMHVTPVFLCNTTSYGPLVALARGIHGTFTPASLSGCFHVFVSGGAGTFPRPSTSGVSQNHIPCGFLSVSGYMIVLAARGNLVIPQVAAPQFPILSRHSVAGVNGFSPIDRRVSTKMAVSMYCSVGCSMQKVCALEEDPVRLCMYHLAHFGSHPTHRG